MPRSTVALTPTPLDGDTITIAAGAVWRAERGLAPASDAFEVRTVDDGAVLQVLSSGVVVLSVLRPRMLTTLDEVTRLLPDATISEVDHGWWSEAYTPWGLGGEIGVAILNEAAQRLGGHAWHADFTPPPQAPAPE